MRQFRKLPPGEIPISGVKRKIRRNHSLRKNCWIGNNVDCPQSLSIKNLIDKLLEKGESLIMMKEDWVYRRGDIYLANLGKPAGSQQGGVRPVVILQNDIGNYFSPTITLVPLTSKINKKKKLPTHYYLKKAKGLQMPSMVLAEQVGTYDKSCILRYIGKVSKGQMRGIDDAVKIQLGYYIEENIERKRGNRK